MLQNAQIANEVSLRFLIMENYFQPRLSLYIYSLG
jgi:hypothetical protein